MPHVLSLDAGTTSCRAIVFDERGAIAAVAQKEFEQHFPKPGWVEHNADEIWGTKIGVAAEALAQARLAPGDLRGIGITNQRETAVIWDRRTGVPIHRAIVWQDRRTSGLCDELRAAGHAGLIQQRTGLLIDAYFSATKIAWLLDNVPGARAAAEAGQLAFGTIDTWLVWKLTGGKRHVTDATNASRTMLYNIHSGEWDADLLRLLAYAAGTPGGLFAPMLVLGAQAGLYFGTFACRWFPIAGSDPTAYAITGMAAFFTATVRAPVTGIILVIELTGSYPLLLSMLAACFTAMLVPTLTGNPPIYESLRKRPEDSKEPRRSKRHGR